MARVQTNYTRRLPYGLWYDPATRVEAIFDRGYKAIAYRHIDRPEAVTVLAERRYIKTPIETWFYTDSKSPGVSTKAEARCETVLSRFMLGCDVRGFIVIGSDKVKDLQGSYIPLKPRPREDYGYGERLGGGLVGYTPGDLAKIAERDRSLF
jgi:hypothetical protein